MVKTRKLETILVPTSAGGDLLVIHFKSPTGKKESPTHATFEDKSTHYFGKRGGRQSRGVQLIVSQLEQVAAAATALAST